MKSQQYRVLLHAFDGLILDACQAYPELKGSLSKDREKIALYFQNRGLGLFTLDLPNLSSLLLRGLENGRLSLEGPLCKRVSKRIKVPVLFSGLWLRIFGKDSRLKPEADENAVAFLQQFTCFGKKLLVDCAPFRRKAALENYHVIEEGLRPPSANWMADSLTEEEVVGLDLVDLGRHPHGSWGLHSDQGELFATAHGRCVDLQVRDFRLLEQCQRVADLVLTAFGNYDPLFQSWLRERESRGLGFRHGPGAVASGQKNHEKSGFPYWSRKLENRFKFGVTALCRGDKRELPQNHEVPSRLICVKKSAKAPRIIAAEPVEHMWCQQAIWAFLEDKVNSTFRGAFLNFRNQKASSDLVLSSSLDQKLVTVDLSDASDRLSCWTVERLFRSNFSILSALHAARTRWLVDNVSNQSIFIKLKKFASQGTATTFPVQSLVFLFIALSSTLGDEEVTWESIWKYREKVRVYGDDIIIPRHGYARLLRLMELLQLKVNVAKSYANGNFRESCGVHGFKGYDVTPCTPETVVVSGPESVWAVIDTINNLFNKGYWHASHNLWSTVPLRLQRRLRIVGPADSGYPGLHSYSGSYERHLDERWNQSLHRFEVRILRLSERNPTETREGFLPLLDFFARGFSTSVARTVSLYSRRSRSARKLALHWDHALDCSGSGHDRSSSYGSTHGWSNEGNRSIRASEYLLASRRGQTR